MILQKNFYYIFPIFSLASCRPSSTGSFQTTAPVVTGLAAVNDLKDDVNGSFKVFCLDGTTSISTQKEIETNAVCQKKAASVPPQVSVPGAQGGDPIALYFGTNSFVKTNAAWDCSGADSASCIENQTSCRISVVGSPVEFRAQNIQISDVRPYDHIRVKRSSTDSCKLTDAFIFFPHLIVPLKFKTQATFDVEGADCNVGLGTSLEGAIQSHPSATGFDFRVTKVVQGPDCMLVDTVIEGVDFSTLDSPSPLIKAVVGQ